MAETRRRSETPVECDISGCTAEAERSISTKRVEKVGLTLRETVGKRAHVCKTHYREFKKRTKKERELESLGW